MIANSEAVQRAPEQIGGTIWRAGEVTGLARIYDPSVMLAVAPLPPSEEAMAHAQTLLGAGERRTLAHVDTPEGIPIPEPLRRLAVHESEHADAWTAYLEQVTEVFSYLLDARCVGVRLIVSDAPHCPRFHVDRVVARAVLTVTGPGTEWLDHAYVDRTCLGHAGHADASSGLVRDWDRLEHAGPGELAVFKGAAWEGAEERTIVHRSPPADGNRRVVLTLDWLE